MSLSQAKPQVPAAQAALQTDRPAQAPRLDSASLFAGRREIVIEHGGCEYRLRRTRTDKLILTK
ncbi:MAG: hemin uptake protein HemP [Xanthomonadales bacterium]|nr:hemin uptake protein HemP [Xanthomonadales bacterium]